MKDTIVEKGSRSPGWDLSKNTERAKRDKHPEAEWLTSLAQVINEEAAPSTLDDWPAWAKA